MKKKRAEKVKEIDDGRVIAPMNVDGMPWYSKTRVIPAVESGVESVTESAAVPVVMTRRESLAFAFGVIKAALLVSLAFIGGLYLFILFCVNIWFR